MVATGVFEWLSYKGHRIAVHDSYEQRTNISCTNFQSEKGPESATAEQSFESGVCYRAFYWQLFLLMKLR